jgi:hypothetical protein
MVMDLELYKNDQLDTSASAVNIPMETELFFDKDVRGNPLQIAFETSDSQYRFIKAESYLEVYDKAKFPFKQGMSEFSNQKALFSTIYRINGARPVNRNNGTIIGTASKVIGPDGRLTALSFDEDITLQAGFTVIVSTSSTPVIRGEDLVEAVSFGSVVSGNVTYHFVTMVCEDGDVFDSSNSLCDLRVFSTAVNQSVLAYFYEDIANNFGKNVGGGL